MYEAGKFSQTATGSTEIISDKFAFKTLSGEIVGDRRKAASPDLEKWLDAIQSSRAIMSEILAFDFTPVSSDWREKEKEVA